jgi:hypothetical protein
MNRTSDIPACSAVPQPTAPPRAPKSPRETGKKHEKRHSGCQVSGRRSEPGTFLIRSSTTIYPIICQKYITNCEPPSLYNFTHPPLNSDFFVLCPVIINLACSYRDAELCLHRLYVLSCCSHACNIRFYSEEGWGRIKTRTIPKCTRKALQKWGRWYRHASANIINHVKT